MPVNHTNPDDPAKLETTREPGIVRRLGQRKTTYIVTLSMGTKPDGSRRQIRRSFPDFAAAKDFKLRTLHEVRDASYVEPSRERVGDYLERWLDAQSSRIRPSTVATYGQCCTRLSSLASFQLREVTPARIHQAIKGLQVAGAAPSTIALTLRVVRGAFDDAVRNHLLKENPVRQVDPPRDTRDRPPVLSSEEVRAFRAAIEGDPLRALWELALETGMRYGEMAALRWDDVDFDALTVRVERTISRDENQHRTVGPPKTPTSRRVIAISAEVAALLRGHRVKFAEWRLLDPTWNRDGLVFPNGLGKPAYAADWMHALRRACERAGVPRLNLHGLRHTSGTEQIEAGIPIKTVAERLGHTSVKTTLDLYVHPDRAAHQRAAEAMSARLRKPSDKDVTKTG